MYPFQLRSRVDRKLFANNLQVISALLFLTSLIALTGCGGLSYRGSGSLSGTPTSTASDLTQISCGTQSLVGAQTKTCSVDLSAKAATALQVTLQSSNGALQVPATVSVQSGAQSATFDIVASNVTKAVSVTISGTAHGKKKSTALTLYPPATPSLTNVSCAAQTVTGPATDSCSISLSAAPTSPVVVTLQSSSSYLTVPGSVSVTAGSSTASFQATASALSSPITATITASLGGVSVSNPLQLNAASGSNSTTQHIVNLSWNPPSSVTDLIGYHVYRSFAGASSFQLLDSTLTAQSSYADNTVSSGQSYDYEVTSIASSGAESSPSNITTVSIP